MTKEKEEVKDQPDIKDALNKIDEGQPKKKMGGCLKFLVIFLIVLAVIAGIVYLLFFSSFALPGTGLKGESKGQVNILVLGKGGEGHSGGNLTDTIMLVMIRNKEKKVAMLSIPRDLWVETPGYGGSKINAVYAQALNNGESEEDAIQILEDHVEDITGIDPSYYAMVDFEGLADIVDTLGSVDVYVDTAFTDTLHSIDYPQGYNNFTGDEAVMYTRARYATGGEGSDFQRADRQQDLIMAIKDKALTSETLLSPSTLSDLSKQYKQHITTDISIRELSRMKVLAGDLSDESSIKAVYSTSNVLYSTKSAAGAYILLPNSGDWSETKMFASNLFKDNPTVQILNGTKQAGIASEITSQLEASGYNLLNPSDANKNTYIKTTVYDNSGGQYKDFTKELAKKYSGETSKEMYKDSKADIVVVVGEGEERVSITDKISNFFSRTLSEETE